MAGIDWRIQGPELVTCNCDWGCPCQFSGRPTQGHCRAAVAMRIDTGHFGDISLDGLCWVGLFAWPGAIHEGQGEAQPIVDERADEQQRGALLRLLSGQEGEPGANMFSVFASTIETMYPPLFRPILFEADVDGRTGRFEVPDRVEARVEPIRNPVTGEPQRAQVRLPGGFEFLEAEFASSTAHAAAPIPLDWARGHAHLTMLHMTPQGPVA